MKTYLNVVTKPFPTFLLTDAQISRQIQYILEKGYIAAIEFNEISDPTEFYWSMCGNYHCSVLEVLKKC